MRENLTNSLQSGIQQLGLSVSHDAQQQMLDFLRFLQKWNNAYNLTAIHSLQQMVSLHLLDSLSIAPYVAGARVLDVGTGAGFPGVPLALYYPDKQFVLLDGNGKKIRFLLQAQAHFKIPNIQPVQERVEKFSDPAKFDVIICRAVGQMHSIIQASQHLLSPNGRWLLMKGTYPQDELNDIEKPYQVEKLEVPGIEAPRHLIVVENH